MQMSGIFLSELGQSTTAWKAVEKVAAVDGGIYIYTSALAAVIVPRRAFASQLEFDEFVRMAGAFHEKAAAWPG